MPPDEELVVEDQDGVPSPAVVVPEDSLEAKSFWSSIVSNDILDQTEDDHLYLQMLDFFPLQRQELLHILGGHKNYMRRNKTPGESTSADSFSAIFGEPVLFSEDNHEPRSKEGDYCKKRCYVEEEFLPEAPLILQQALDNVFLLGSGHDDSPVYQFLEAIATVLGRRGSRSALTIMFQVVVASTASSSEQEERNGLSSSLSSPTSTAPMVKAEDLISLTYRLILAMSYLRHGHPTLKRQHPRSWVYSLAEFSTIKNQYGEALVTLPVWMDWTQSVAPQIEKTLGTFCHYALFGTQHPFRNTNSPLSLPLVLNDDVKSALWTFPYQGIPSSLALLSNALGGPWIQLYSSDTDGCSFRAMQESLLSYHGTTVILIQTTAGDAFGYYTNCPWRESRHWYGEHEATESFLFGLKPSLLYFAPTSTTNKPYYMFLHNPVYPHPTDLNGLAIGGINDKTPRLHITTNFEQCKAGSMDAVYSSGPLLSDGELFFDIDLVEVYALSCTAEEFEMGLSRGMANTAIREGTRLKAARVDKKQFLEDFQTGQYMNNAFTHRDQTRGRHSFVAHEDGSSGYFIDSKSPSKRRLLEDDPEHVKNEEH
jgi:TLD